MEETIGIVVALLSLCIVSYLSYQLGYQDGKERMLYYFNVNKRGGNGNPSTR